MIDLSIRGLADKASQVAHYADETAGDASGVGDCMLSATYAISSIALSLAAIARTVALQQPERTEKDEGEHDD